MGFGFLIDKNVSYAGQFLIYRFESGEGLCVEYNVNVFPQLAKI